MSDRLTAEHLDLLERALVAVENDYRPTCESANYGSGCPGPTDATLDFWRRATDCTQAMITEIRNRRAADLADSELTVLDQLRSRIALEWPNGNALVRAVSVLDKLLKAKP